MGTERRRARRRGADLGEVQGASARWGSRSPQPSAADRSRLSRAKTRSTSASSSAPSVSSTAGTLTTGGCMPDTSSPEYGAWAKGARTFGKAIWEAAGERVSPTIVFDHPGEATIPTSIFVASTGGMVVICAGTSGYNATLDLRYHWMRQKRFQGSHLSNDEQAAAVKPADHRQENGSLPVTNLRVRRDRRGASVDAREPPPLRQHGSVGQRHRAGSRSLVGSDGPSHTSTTIMQRSSVGRSISCWRRLAGAVVESPAPRPRHR